MFSFTREGLLFILAGLIGAAVAPGLLHQLPTWGIIGGLTTVLPVTAAYALGHSVALRLPRRYLAAAGSVLFLGSLVALWWRVGGFLGPLADLLLVIVAAVGLRDGLDAFLRGALAVGITGLVICFVLLPMIPAASGFLFVICVSYLLVRHLWGVLGRDIPVMLRHNAGA